MDQVIRDVAAPVLSELGFRRAGRIFRCQGGRGDVGIVNFGSYRLGKHDAEFSIALAVVVVPHLARASARGVVTKPGKENIEDAFHSSQLFGPHGRGGGGAPSQHWGLNIDDKENAAVFQAALQEAAVGIKQLAERENLIAAVRDPKTIPQGFRVHPRNRALAMLLVDEKGHDDELEQLLSEIQGQERGGTDFVAWARSRRAEQMS